MNKVTVPWSSIAVALAVVAIGAVVATTLSLNQTLPDDASIAHGAYAFDVSDREKLSAFASDIFVGRVVKRVGAEGIPLSGPGNAFIPHTQFRFDIQETLKGEASGTVVIDQPGGTDHTCQLELMEGVPLLTMGQTALLVTRHNPADDRYRIVDNHYGIERLHTAKERKDAVGRFKRAVAQGPTGPVSAEQLNPDLRRDRPDPAVEQAAAEAVRERCAAAARRGRFDSVEACLARRPRR